MQSLQIFYLPFGVTLKSESDERLQIESLSLPSLSSAAGVSFLADVLYDDDEVRTFDGLVFESTESWR